MLTKIKSTHIICEDSFENFEFQMNLEKESKILLGFFDPPDEEVYGDDMFFNSIKRINIQSLCNDSNNIEQRNFLYVLDCDNIKYPMESLNFICSINIGTVPYGYLFEII